MPYPAESIMNTIRAAHQEALTRPIDFVVAPDAAIAPAYTALIAQHQNQIDEMIRDATFGEKLIQMLAATGGAYVVYKAGTAQATAGFTLNPVTACANALGGLFNQVAAAPIAMLSMAMAATTFNAIYTQMGAQGHQQAYQDHLHNELANNEAYSALIKQAFDNMAEEMLRAFCLREIRLKSSVNQAEKEEINQAYLTHVLHLLNQTIKTVYGDHQADIDAERDQWWLWTMIKQYFVSPEERNTTTQAIQLGLLTFVSDFHQHLADEKTWIGKHPIRFSTISGVLGVVLGIAATAFVGSLAALVWPIALAAVAGGLLFAAIGLLYAKKAPYKRTSDERLAHAAFKEAVDSGEDALKARLLQTNTLSVADVQLLEQHKSSVTHGYLTRANVAVGTPASWLRTFAKHYAHSKVVENDFAPLILNLAARAAIQTTELVEAIRLSTAENGQLHPNLERYISATRQYLLQDNGISLQKKYEFIEKTKEQLLEAIAQVGNIALTPNLNTFFKALYGNDDQLELARIFCPMVSHDHANVTAYNPLLEKANQLDGILRNKPQPVLLGSNDYWLSLGINPPQQPAISDATIDELLYNSLHFLREISPPVRRGNETEATHSEAYYLYRTLLMRQLAELVFTHKIHVEKIKTFIQNSLHETIGMAASVDDVLSDIFYHEIHKPTPGPDHRTIAAYPTATVKGVEYVASALRIDLAYHPITSPAAQLEQCINTYVETSEMVFGDTRPEALAQLNFENIQNLETMNLLIENSLRLLNSLNTPPSPNEPWNKAPINLYYAYKDVMTRQALFTLKSIVQSLSRCNPNTDGEKIHALRQAFIRMNAFLSESCYQLEDSHAAKQFLASYNLSASVDDNHHELVILAQLHVESFDLSKIYEGDIRVNMPELKPLQTNLKLIKIEVVELDAETVLVNYLRGRDSEPVHGVEPRIAQQTVSQKLYDYFSNKLAEFIPTFSFLDNKEKQLHRIRTLGLFAKGTPAAWERTRKIYQKNHPESAGYLEESIGQYERAAIGKMNELILELKNNDGKKQPLPKLESYIKDASTYLESNLDKDTPEKNIAKEHMKELLLTVIAESEIKTIPDQLLMFVNEKLGGNDDQIVLAQHFCPITDDEGAYRHLMTKADELCLMIQNEKEHRRDVLLGDTQYRYYLGQQPIEQAPITPDSIRTLLNNTKLFLRKLSRAVEFDDMNNCRHTEAFYLYRTLLIRQLAMLVHDQRVEQPIKEIIKAFINNTLHVDPELILEDICAHNDETEHYHSNLSLVAGAIRLDLAYHPALSPIALLDDTIATYLKVRHHALIFGDSNPTTLAHLSPENQAQFLNAIPKFLEDTFAFSQLLASSAERHQDWDNAPIDLNHAYKHRVTKGAIQLLKTILESLSKSDPENIPALRRAYSQVYKFLTNENVCYGLHDDTNETATQTLRAFYLYCTEMNDVDLRQKAIEDHSKINLDEFRNQNYILQRTPSDISQSILEDEVIEEVIETAVKFDASIFSSCMFIEMNPSLRSRNPSPESSADKGEPGALVSVSINPNLFFAAEAEKTPAALAEGQQEQHGL